MKIFIGIDVGTQGVRTIAATEKGGILSSHKHSFPLGDYRQEQSPDMWWSALISCLQEVAGDLRKEGCLQRVEAISVTSTSGTMIPLDRNYQPIHPALMYSDQRSKAEADYCRQASKGDHSTQEVPYNPSYGLPKILWFINNYPEKIENIHIWSHAGDYILGKLSGVWGVTDYTNALKTGFDLLKEEWPNYLFSHLSLDSHWFPKVVKPGFVLGPILSEVAESTGLPDHVQIVAGMTDGCASQIAAGSIRPGDWNTTIGTTMVIKGVTLKPIHDPLGRIYNHKHPQGYWMPGGASNTGADWISTDYHGENLEHLNHLAENLVPTPWIVYPLKQAGERFPFLSTEARGFAPEGLTKEQLFAASLEGVAYLERMSYEMVEKLSGEQVNRVYTAGGGSLSDVWLNIRSNVLDKPVYKMKWVEGAVGAAVIAGSGYTFANVEEAAAQMIHLEKVVEPGKWAAIYRERYEEFRQSLVKKGYLNQ